MVKDCAYSKGKKTFWSFQKASAILILGDADKRRFKTLLDFQTQVSSVVFRTSWKKKKIFTFSRIEHHWCKNNFISQIKNWISYDLKLCSSTVEN